MNKSIQDVIAERKRQIKEEGWTAGHDNGHRCGELARAGACYAVGKDWVHISRQINSSRGADLNCYQYDFTRPAPGQITWPWDEEWWKPTTRRRNLVKAAALIIAEIDRLDRLALQGEEG